MKYTYGGLLLAICLLGVVTLHSAYAISSASITYLKDGIKINGETVYKVDYGILKFSDDWPYEKPPLGKISATNNSNVVVTDSEVITNLVFKMPSKDNPNSYNIDSTGGTFKIMTVEMLGDQLNKYILKFPVELTSYTISPILTETSPTTAVLNITNDFPALTPR